MSCDLHLQLQESKVQGELLQSAVATEQAKSLELENRLILQQEQEQALKEELESCQTQLHSQSEGKKPHRHSSNPSNGSSAVNDAQLLFLKQAVYHLLTDFHAEEQLRAIISILDFSAQERKAVYSKLQEKGGLYR